MLTQKYIPPYSNEVHSAILCWSVPILLLHQCEVSLSFSKRETSAQDVQYWQNWPWHSRQTLRWKPFVNLLCKLTTTTTYTVLALAQLWRPQKCYQNEPSKKVVIKPCLIDDHCWNNTPRWSPGINNTTAANHGEMLPTMWPAKGRCYLTTLTHSLSQTQQQKDVTTLSPSKTYNAQITRR